MLSVPNIFRRIRNNLFVSKTSTIALCLTLLFLLIVVNLAFSHQSTSEVQAVSDTLFEETFESDLSAWTVVDEDGSTNGEYFWATTTYTSSQGASSVWASGGGAQGSTLTPGTNGYPNNSLASMTAGPFDASGATSLALNYDFWTLTQEDVDLLLVKASTDGSSFTTLDTRDGNSSGWKSVTLDLSTYAGEDQVWIEFTFSSNATVVDSGVFIDNVSLVESTESITYFPFIQQAPPPPSYYYLDEFDDPSSGWPTPDNRWNPQDCFRWFYSNGTYASDICDDRTDVKVSPLVALPTGDYEITVPARFREPAGWWTSYGIMFDAKDDPDPTKPDLGDYYMVWVLWEGVGKHKWKILRDYPGGQADVTAWQILDTSVYNYENSGTAYNTWRIERTSTKISVYVNDALLITVNENRPTTNQQILFGLYNSTYETSSNKVGFDSYQVIALDGSSLRMHEAPPPGVGTYSSGAFSLENMLPE